jgi:AraC-like DNA-binding protein
VDTLSDVLRTVRLSGAFFFDVHARAPWVAETPSGSSIVDAMFPGSDHLISYHLLIEGSCWLELDGEEPLHLQAGDIIVLPHGDTHVLCTEPGMRKSPQLSMYRRPETGPLLPARIHVGSDEGPPARFVCGFLGCDSRPYNPLLNALPRMIHIGNHASGALGEYFKLALAESRNRMGGECMLSRISELMFVDVVRRHLECLPADRSNWLSGLRDAYVGRALMALHEDPARDWTLEALAQEAALSRSAFAERFTQFVGQPPMQYLAQWRMQLATNYLRNGSESVAAIAGRVGYESEASFSRAFKKLVGVPPSEWRGRVHPAPASVNQSKPDPQISGTHRLFVWAAWPPHKRRKS